MPRDVAVMERPISVLLSPGVPPWRLFLITPCIYPSPQMIFGNCRGSGFRPLAVLAPREGTSFFLKLHFHSFPSRGSQSKARNRSVFEKLIPFPSEPSSDED